MAQIKYGILHWGPCVVKIKADPETLDLLLSEGESSKEDASPELAGVLKNQFHYRDKKKFIKKDPNITKDNGVGAADIETH